MTITQEEALQILNTPLHDVEAPDNFGCLSDIHIEMDNYLNAKPRSLTSIGSTLFHLIGHMQSNLYKLGLFMDYGHILNADIQHIKNSNRCPVKLRVCIYQLLAKSIILELLANVYTQQFYI